MTITDPKPDQTDETRPPERRRFLPRLELSGTQLIAAALAAVTATVAGSYLGVSGTVIGAALASVLTAVGNAVYGHSIRSTRDRVRVVVPGTRFAPRPMPAGTIATPLAARQEPPPALPVRGSRPERSTTRAPWRSVAIGAVTVFVAALALVTSIELVAGRPLSDLLRGDNGSGTSVFGTNPVQEKGSGDSSPVPTVTTTVTPSVVVTTPTVTRTAAPVTETATPTVTSTSAPASPSTTATSVTGTTMPGGSAPPLG